MPRLHALLSILLPLLLCTFFLRAAVAGPLIEQIEFDGSGSNADRFIFKLNSSNLPNHFALKDPPRAVFDFPDTALAKGLKTNIPVTGKFIKGIRAAEYRGDKAKTRVVLDVAAEQPIDFKQDFDAETKTLVISIFAQGTKPAPAAVAEAPEKSMPPVPEAGKTAEAVTPPPTPPAEHKDAPRTAEPAAEPAAPPTPSATEKDAPPAVAAIPKQEAGAGQTREDGTNIQPLSEIGSQEAGKDGNLPPVLYSIEFDKDGNRGETINFKLSTFNPPVVFGIEEDTPRVVCFFKDTAAGPELKDNVAAKGRFVKSIQVGKFSNPNNVRVVLELMPNQNYDLQQVFFKEDNMFMIIINTGGQSS